MFEQKPVGVKDIEGVGEGVFGIGIILIETFAFTGHGFDIVGVKVGVELFVIVGVWVGVGIILLLNKALNPKLQWGVIVGVGEGHIPVLKYPTSKSGQSPIQFELPNKIQEPPKDDDKHHLLSFVTEVK